MSTLQMRRHRVAASHEIPEGGRLVVDIGELTIGVFRVKGSLHAYENTCAHQGGPVCQGRIMPGVAERLVPGSDDTSQYMDEEDLHLVCPWHGYEYRLTTGRHAGVDRIALRRFDVEETDGEVHVLL